jgi:hypothetical protein
MLGRFIGHATLEEREGLAMVFHGQLAGDPDSDAYLCFYVSI